MSYKSKTFKRTGWTLEVEVGIDTGDTGGETQAYLTHDRTGASASLECALSTGEADGNGRSDDVNIPQTVLDWAEKTAADFGY